jgi:uncharacterized ion transporter superfamily protein YfcC
MVQSKVTIHKILVNVVLMFLVIVFRIVSKGYYTEQDAALCIREILEAIVVGTAELLKYNEIDQNY